MEYWEFLIQREGDREWRPIKTGNLQLMEGKYRIVANSNLTDTQVHTRVTYQTAGTTTPQRKTQARNQATNGRGLIVIIPFTQLHSGIWQFVCSGTTATETAWHQILKLRVLPRTETPSPVAPVTSTSTAPPAPEITSNRFPTVAGNEEILIPTELVIPIAIVDPQPNWADGLDRLLEQLEWDSLHPPQQPVRATTLSLIQLTPISNPPLQLIDLDRSTFAGVIPGNRVGINGTCNLKLFNANLVQTVTISKLLICLRHPQTSEIIVAIEQALPPNLDTFAFSGQLELPSELTTSLLLGYVNLYDRHNIQLSSIDFTVTIDLDPKIPESELSFLQLLDTRSDSLQTVASSHADLITKELQLELSPPQPRTSTRQPSTPSSIQPITASQYPSIPLAYRRESLLAQHSDIAPVEPSSSPTTPQQQPHPSQPVGVDITGDLELDFALPSSTRPHHPRNWDTLEIVVDD